MNMTALPYYHDGKRVLFPGAENFGPGSFCPDSRLHTFKLRGKSILPCKVVTLAKDSVSSKLDHSVEVNEMLIKLFEN